ncbi:MAG TPA: hypothetical protein DCF33_10940 [Saprospirales bacterium]|nr:hypothetical protein [Saprospirales bacterium]
MDRSRYQAGYGAKAGLYLSSHALFPKFDLIYVTPFGILFSADFPSTLIEQQCIILHFNISSKCTQIATVKKFIWTSVFVCVVTQINGGLFIPQKSLIGHNLS